MEQHYLNQVAYAQKTYELSLAKVVKLLGKKGMYRLSLSSVGTVESVHLARSTTPEYGTFVLRVFSTGEPPTFGHFNLLGKWQLGVAKSFKLDVGRLYTARSLADLEQLALVEKQRESIVVAAAAVCEPELLPVQSNNNNLKKKKMRRRRKKKNNKKKKQATKAYDDETSSTSTGATSSSQSSPNFTAFSPPNYGMHINMPVSDITVALAGGAVGVATASSFGSNSCCEHDDDDHDHDDEGEDETAFARDALQMTAAVKSAARRSVRDASINSEDGDTDGDHIDSSNARQRVLELEARFGKLPDSGVMRARKESIRLANEEEKKQQQRAEIFESISTNLFDDYVMQEKKRMEREAKTTRGGGDVDGRFPFVARAKRNTRALSISSASSASLSSRSNSPSLHHAPASPSSSSSLSRSLQSELDCLGEHQFGRCEVIGRKNKNKVNSGSVSVKIKNHRQRCRGKNEQEQLKQHTDIREDLPEDH